MEGQRRGGRTHPPAGRVPPGPINREKTCPLLLRVFTKFFEKCPVTYDVFEHLCLYKTPEDLAVGAHHFNMEFAVRGKEPKDELQIYTWKDATLRELTDLVKEVVPEARRKYASLSFALVYPFKTGELVVRKVGRTLCSPDASRQDDGSKALRDFDFEIGDYLDVAVL